MAVSQVLPCHLVWAALRPQLTLLRQPTLWPQPTLLVGSHNGLIAFLIPPPDTAEDDQHDDEAGCNDNESNDPGRQGRGLAFAVAVGCLIVRNALTAYIAAHPIRALA